FALEDLQVLASLFALDQAGVEQGVDRPGLRRLDADLAHPLPVHRLHGPGRAVRLESGARLGYLAEDRIDVAAHRVVLLALAEPQPKLVAELVDRVAAVDQRLGLGDELERLLLRLVVLVADLADDL